MSLDADVAAPSVGGRLAGDGHAGDGSRHVGGGHVGGGHVGGGHAGDLNLMIIRATDEEAAAHEAILEKIARIGDSPD